ncbi:MULTISPECIES: Rieske (2Fe-2S) protein [Streptosporangium]|uniref:Rieske domain-containing protein n=1 Tax=Streptosporangium longisporum TaxID=46187 RepID=A0ABP6KHF3_9ACTN
MSARVRVELEWPRHNAVRAGDETYFFLERSGSVHLIHSRCPHRGGPLHLGEIEDERLRCPWHGSTFRVDRLCDRAVPTIQRGSSVVAYLPAGLGEAVPVHQMVFAS